MCLTKNVICFKHCCAKSIFCNKVPAECPICNESVATFKLEPFLVPYPLVNAKDYPCCVVVRPSNGDFLDYNVSDDLHIGVTDLDGNVVEYDKCGLVKNDNAKWKKCVAISIVPSSWEVFWDEILSEICNDNQWNVMNYNNATFNCFSFVITFLNNLKYKDIQFMSKENMCEVFILPKIQAILKYASLCRQLKDKKFYVQE